MPTTDNLQIDYLEESQNDKYVTVNEGFNALDNAFNGGLTVGDLVGDTYISTTNFLRNFFFTLQDGAGSPNLTGDFEVIVPEINRFFAVYNSTDFTATLRTGSTASETVELLPLQRAFIYCDGTDLYAVGLANRYTINAFFSGAPASGQTILILEATAPFTLVSGLPGSAAYAEIAPADGAATFNVFKNATNIGTVTFDLGSNDGVFNLTSTIDYAIGDRLKLQAPNPADSALESISFNIEGTR